MLHLTAPPPLLPALPWPACWLQDDGLHGVGGGLGDTESLMNALDADSFLADVPTLPRLEMDDFLDSFLTSDDKGMGCADGGHAPGL